MLPQSERTIHTHELSPEAVTYLKAQVRRHRQIGIGVTNCVNWANAWANGYRAHGRGYPRLAQSAHGGREGWEYAAGEADYVACMNGEAVYA